MILGKNTLKHVFMLTVFSKSAMCCGYLRSWMCVMVASATPSEKTKDRLQVDVPGAQPGFVDLKGTFLAVAVMALAFPVSLVCLLNCMPNGTSDPIKLSCIVLVFASMCRAALLSRPFSAEGNLSKGLAELLSAIAVHLKNGVSTKSAELQ
jgi:hypothetical protein